MNVMSQGIPMVIRFTFYLRSSPWIPSLRHSYGKSHPDVLIYSVILHISISGLGSSHSACLHDWTFIISRISGILSLFFD